MLYIQTLTSIQQIQTVIDTKWHQITRANATGKNLARYLVYYVRLPHRSKVGSLLGYYMRLPHKCLLRIFICIARVRDSDLTLRNSQNLSCCSIYQIHWLWRMHTDYTADVWEFLPPARDLGVDTIRSGKKTLEQHTHTLTHAHTYSLFLSISHTHSLPHTQMARDSGLTAEWPLDLEDLLTHNLLSLSHAHTRPYTQTHTRTHAHTHTRTHTHTHTQLVSDSGFTAE